MNFSFDRILNRKINDNSYPFLPHFPLTLFTKEIWPISIIG